MRASRQKKFIVLFGRPISQGDFLLAGSTLVAIPTLFVIFSFLKWVLASEDMYPLHQYSLPKSMGLPCVNMGVLPLTLPS